MLSILEYVESAAFESLPIFCAQIPRSSLNKKTIPGWSEQVKPFRDKAMFWDQIWKSAGKPVNCELHNIKKRSRNLYHYKLRKVKKSEDFIRKHNLLNACLNGFVNHLKKSKK